MATNKAEVVLSATDKTQAAFASVSRSFSQLEATAGKLGLALPALTLGAAGGALSALALEAAKAIDEFNDLRDATGASIENISALDRVARETGGSFDTAASILVKFNKVLSEADDESKGAGAILKSLGLDAEALKRIDPAEALRQTAVALAKFADDGNKARGIQVLFGKSVKEAAPFLKDLAEQTALVATTTTKAAENAEEFRKNLFRLGADAQDFARNLATGVIPIMNQVFKDFRDFGKNASLSSLAGDVIGLDRQLKGLEGRRGTSRQYSGLAQDIEEAAEKLQAAKAKFRQADEAGNPGTFAVPGSGDFSRMDRRTLPSLTIPKDPKSTGGAPKDPLAEAKRYLENLQKQREKTRDLSVEEQALLDIQQKRLGPTNAAIEKQILAEARLLDLSRELSEAQKDRIKDGRALATSEGEAVNKTNEEYQKLLQSLLDAGPSAQLEKQRQTMLMLANAYETGAISAAQFEDAAKGFLDLTDKTSKELDDFAKRAAENIQDSIGDGLVDLMEGNYKNIGDGFVKMINRMVADAAAAELSRWLFGDLVSGGSGSGKGSAGGLLEGFGKMLLGGGSGGRGATVQTEAQMGDGFAKYMAGSSSGGSGVLSSVGSWLSNLLSFDVGTDFVPQDMVAKIHKGERIIPAVENKPGYGGNTVNLTVNQSFSPGTSRATTLQAAADARRQLEYAGRNL